MKQGKIVGFFLMLLLSGVVACQQRIQMTSETINEAEVLHNNQEKLTQLIIYDVFNPPVASRIYSYASLASYEAIRFGDSSYPSLITQLHGFDSLVMPHKDKTYNYTLAATKAFFTVVRKVTFSVDSLDAYENGVYARFHAQLDDSTYQRSLSFGESVGNLVLKRAAKDNYSRTRGMPKYLGSSESGNWRPTGPDYMDGAESHWSEMKTFVLDSASALTLPPPPAYSNDKESVFYKQNLELYNACNKLTAEQADIAKYWDDNSLVMEHSGHLSFANKKITPGGHWIGITQIACKKVNADEVKTAQSYALISVALFEAFTACWDVKYKTGYVRPITVIQEKIDPRWFPMLQTPPFPEYPSGHSTITRAAAELLTHLYGDNFAFQDTSNFKYIGMKRDFRSFVHAADEASISRFYGGIHYMNSLAAGAELGRKVSEMMLAKLKIRQ